MNKQSSKLQTVHECAATLGSRHVLLPESRLQGPPLPPSLRNQRWSSTAKASAATKRRPGSAMASGIVSPLPRAQPTPKELVAALAVFGRPGASDEEQSEALEKLSAHLNALLEAADNKREAAATKKRMASALSQIKELAARVAKMEKASAAAARRESERHDLTLSWIEAAAANTRLNAEKPKRR